MAKTMCKHCVYHYHAGLSGAYDEYCGIAEERKFADDESCDNFRNKRNIFKLGSTLYLSGVWMLLGYCYAEQDNVSIDNWGAHLAWLTIGGSLVMVGLGLLIAETARGRK